MIERAQHLGAILAHTQTAHGVAVEIEGKQRLGATFSLRLIRAALHDAEEVLIVRTRVGVAAAFCPRDGAVDGFRDGVVGRR